MSTPAALSRSTRLMRLLLSLLTASGAVFISIAFRLSESSSWLVATWILAPYALLLCLLLGASEIAEGPGLAIGLGGSIVALGLLEIGFRLRALLILVHALLLVLGLIVLRRGRLKCWLGRLWLVSIVGPVAYFGLLVVAIILAGH